MHSHNQYGLKDGQDRKWHLNNVTLVMCSEWLYLVPKTSPSGSFHTCLYKHFLAVNSQQCWWAAISNSLLQRTSGVLCTALHPEVWSTYCIYVLRSCTTNSVLLLLTRLTMLVTPIPCLHLKCSCCLWRHQHHAKHCLATLRHLLKHICCCLCTS